MKLRVPLGQSLRRETQAKTHLMPAMENNSRSGGEVPPAQKMQDMVTQLFTQQTLEQVQAKLEDWDSRLQGISIFD